MAQVGLGIYLVIREMVDQLVEVIGIVVELVPRYVPFCLKRINAVGEAGHEAN